MASKLVMSPEPFIQKCKNLAKSKDLHIEVENGLISLAWTAFSEDGLTNKVEYFYRAEAVRLGIPSDLLLDAVLGGGGAIDGCGHYPVTEDIVRGLRKVGLRK